MAKPGLLHRATTTSATKGTGDIKAHFVRFARSTGPLSAPPKTSVRDPKPPFVPPKSLSEVGDGARARERQCGHWVKILHTVGARLNVEAARKSNPAFRVEVTDRDEVRYVEIDKGVLLASACDPGNIDFVISVTHDDLANLAEGKADWNEFHKPGRIDVSGNTAKFRPLTTLF